MKRYRVVRQQAETCYGRRLLVADDLSAVQGPAFIRGLTWALCYVGWTQPDDHLPYYLVDPEGTAWVFTCDDYYTEQKHDDLRFNRDSEGYELDRFGERLLPSKHLQRDREFIGGVHTPVREEQKIGYPCQEHSSKTISGS
jgi:hypothetical protein